MNLLITGGLGFIGSNMVRMLLDGEIGDVSKIYLIDKESYSSTKESLSNYWGNSKLHYIKADICDKDVVNSLLNEVDAVINFAAESHVDNSIKNPEIFSKSNYLGVQNILECIRNTKREVRFLQVSTDEVYGSIDSGSWTESSPLKPNSPYSASKAAADLLALAYGKTYGLDILITRSSNNYGPFQFPEKIIPLFATNLIRNKKVPLYGKGDNHRDWIHVDDNCTAIFEVLIKGKTHSAYNIGGGNHLSNLELSRKILDFFELDEEMIEFVSDRPGHDFRYNVDCTLIKNEIGWSPKINFESGLDETLSWYKQNEDWWSKLL